MTRTTFEGRTFDRVYAYHADIPHVGTLLATYMSQEDKILQAQIDAIKGRLDVLEGKSPTPVPPTPIPVPTGKTWSHTYVLDQEAEGECVGYGVTHALSCDPRPQPVDSQLKNNATAEGIYEAAQKLSGQVPDEQSGTDVASGLKASKLITPHRCTTLAEVHKGIMNVGPVLWGTNWYSNMMNPVGTVVTVKGQNVGGHCYLQIGYEPVGLPDAPNVFLNSWGEGWSEKGIFRMTDADTSRLLAEQGEAYLIQK